MPYAHVQDVEATAKKAEKLGAKVMLGKTEVMGMGWLAIITDPQGAMFGFWQAKG
jgi:predicted enzyme related to lactoylglutathione lyase